MVTVPDLEKLNSAEKGALILQLFDHIATLEAKIKDLESRLAKNSRNSSKPPSSDGYGKPKPKSRRGRSARRSGGQPGHKGHTLEKRAKPDHIADHGVEQCSHCGSDLSQAPVIDIESRQVFDLPPTLLEVTEHRAHIKTCPCCSGLSKGRFPVGVSQPVQYGNRLQAIATYLSQHQLVPYLRLQELFQDLFDVHLSQGTLNNILHRGYQHLEPFERAAKERVINSGCAHFDESGVRVMKKLNWLHVAATDRVTCYEIHPQRGEAAMEAMGILDRFEGYAVHDHWASYYLFVACFHVLCNAHHLRELIHAFEQHGQRWAEKLIDCLLDAKQEVDAAIEAGATSLEESRVTYYDRRYSRILREGRDELPVLPTPKTKKRGRVKQHKVKNLHDRLVNHKWEALAFINDLSVPFDNNQGERDLRMCKVKQKISGCFRSEQGARMFCRIRGYISTAKKQGRNVFTALSAAFEGCAFDPATEKILQAG